jgi:cytochrome c heme-lyase
MTTSREECPVQATESKCPVAHGNVDDPHNNMPNVPEQSPSPGQRMALDTHRVVSTIPKGDFTPDHQKGAADSAASPTWVYPSEQQFFNAMRRKGWAPQEEDMRIVVAIHNTVNERSWQEILRWEAMHQDSCAEGPRLIKFLGRPKDPSPKSLFRRFVMGYTKPFDRHDWTVDRCGVQVRYILDFYRGHAMRENELAYHIDARPALDSFGAAVDRARMIYKQNLA